MQAEASARFCGKVRGGFQPSAKVGIDDLLRREQPARRP